MVGIVAPWLVYLVGSTRIGAFTSLTSSISSLGTLAALVLGPVAWIWGNSLRKQCNQGLFSMTQALKTGRILGIIATSLVLLLIVGGAVFLIVVFTVMEFQG